MEADLIKDPEVLVYIAEYRAKPIYILGQVDRPGQYIMSQQLTLMDAILLAGGLDFTAGRYGYLHRLISEADDSEEAAPAVIKGGGAIGAPQTTVTRIDLQPAKEGGVISPNPDMRRGDTFFVPERKVETFFVVGDVLNAGSFEIPAENKIKVAQAISQAGGPSKTAKLSEGLLVRYDKAGSRKEMAVDSGAILRGDQPDIFVQANDVIFIPGSNAKTVGYGLLNVVRDYTERHHLRSHPINRNRGDMAIGWKSIFAAAILIFAVSLGLHAQATSSAKDSSGQEPSPDYRIGPGDLLSLEVLGLDEFKQETRVSNSGRIHVPYLGLLDVNGLSPRELESEIGRRLERKATRSRSKSPRFYSGISGSARLLPW